MRKKVLIINTFFILYFLNKFLINRYQITQDETRSLLIYTFIVLLFFNFINIISYFFITKNSKILLLNSIWFFLFLNYGSITYFFYFNNLEFLMKIPNYSFFSFIIIFLITTYVVVKLKTDEWIKPVLIFYILFVFLINFPVSFNGDSSNSSKFNENLNIEFHTKPDIYFVLLDGYPNLSIAEEFYSYDTDKIYELFHENNIEVFNNSTAPYNRTDNTLSSIYEMEYLFLPPEMSFRSREVILEEFKNSNSKFEQILRKNGYQIYKYGIKAYCSLEDICLNNYFQELNTKNTVFYDLLMETPFKILIEKNILDTENLAILGCTVNCSESLIDESIVEIRSKINENKNKPTFSFIHLMNSHDPYILDKNCQLLPSPNYKLAKDDPDQFNGNLDCSFSEMSRLINLTNLQNTILIFQSDHGPQYEVMKNVVGNNVESLSENQILSRFTTFSASNVNFFCQNRYENLSGVNTFRILINCLSDEKLPILKDNSYLIFGNSNPSIFDITEKLDQVKN